MPKGMYERTIFNNGRKRIDISGLKNNQLTVISFVEIKNRKSYYLCRCSCGVEKVMLGQSVKYGYAKSCGHVARVYTDEERQKRRERALLLRRKFYAKDKNDRTRISWRAMVQRCTSKNHWKYPRYGGRGIKVTEEWMNFDNFLRDMGERPEGKTIDRIDNDGDYEMSNCKWSNPKEQAMNTSRNKK